MPGLRTDEPIYPETGLSAGRYFRFDQRPAFRSGVGRMSGGL